LYTSNLKQFLFPPSGKEKGDFNAISMSLTGHISHEAVGAKIYKLFFFSILLFIKNVISNLNGYL